MKNNGNLLAVLQGGTQNVDKFCEHSAIGADSFCLVFQCATFPTLREDANGVSDIQLTKKAGNGNGSDKIAGNERATLGGMRQTVRKVALTFAGLPNTKATGSTKALVQGPESVSRKHRKSICSLSNSARTGVKVNMSEKSVNVVSSLTDRFARDGGKRF